MSGRPTFTRVHHDTIAAVIKAVVPRAETIGELAIIADIVGALDGIFRIDDPTFDGFAFERATGLYGGPKKVAAHEPRRV